MLRFVAFLAFVVLIETTGLVAQGHTGDSNQSRPTRRWSVVASSVANWGGGLIADLETAMIAAGLDDDSACWLFCTGTIAHPKSHRPSMGSKFAVSYNFTPAFGLRASWSVHSLGTTHGYRDPFTYMFVRGQVKAASLVAYVSPNGTLRLGAGPAVYLVRFIRYDSPSRGDTSSGGTNVGLVFDVGLTVPRNTRFFLDLGAQYRVVGTGQIGPFETTSLDGSTMTTLDGQASFNHGVLSVGVGMRM